MEPLKYIAYLSNQSRYMTDTDMDQLLKTSRKNNAERQITGMLVHINGTFIQFIEGPQIEIDMLYENITRDPRHDRVILIEEGTIPNRSFSAWSMAYKNLKGENLNTLSGYRPFDTDLLFDYPKEKSAEKLPALILLQNFIRDLQN